MVQLIGNLKNINLEGKSCFLYFDNKINPKTFYSSINQELLLASIKGEDKERKRVSQDLHDVLGQELNAIKLYLVALDQMDKNSSDYQEVISDIKNMVDETIYSVRDISFNCMPASLQHGDLGKSVMQLINRINRIQEGRITFQISEININFENESTLIFCYRIIQEFINNSLKHSSATNINVTIRFNQKIVFIELTDNGCGLTQADLERTSGVENIFNRLKALNARYQFYSKPKLGTKLIFTFNGK
jgi:signal transduction histidine kinase